MDVVRKTLWFYALMLSGLLISQWGYAQTGESNEAAAADAEAAAEKVEEKAEEKAEETTATESTEAEQETSAEEIAAQLAEEELEGGDFGVEIFVGNTVVFKKQKYSPPKPTDSEKEKAKDGESDKKDKDEDSAEKKADEGKKDDKKKDETVYTDSYDLQAENWFNPFYYVEGSYTDNLIAPSVASSVSLGLEGLFNNLAKYSDAPPTISLELVPAETYFRDEDTSLAAVGLEDQTFKFGSLSTYAAVGASTAADFKFKEVGYQSELFFQHVFNPLGSIPMPSLWGFSFVGNAINELTVANDLADLDWPSLDFTQTSAVGLFKYVEGHIIVLSLRNEISNGGIALNKLHEDLFDTDREGFSVIQYARFLYYYVPEELQVEVRFYRLPPPKDSDKSYFETHGFAARFLLGYAI